MTGGQPRANDFRQTPDVCPSHDLGLRRRNTAMTNSSPSAQASAPVSRGIPGQNTYVFCAPPDQRTGEANHATFEVAPAIPCVCTSMLWFPWCPRGLEHFSLAILYSPWFTHPPCYCGWTLSMPHLQRWCPKVASHFLDWVSRDHPMATRGVG